MRREEGMFVQGGQAFQESSREASIVFVCFGGRVVLEVLKEMDAREYCCSPREQSRKVATVQTSARRPYSI